MIKRKYLLAACVQLIMGANAVHAALVDRGSGMIYDSDLNITWLQDANLFKTQYDADNSILGTLLGQTVADSYYGAHTTTASDFFTVTGRMSWWGAQAWASNLSYGGYDDWRLPTTLQPDSSCDYQPVNASYGHNCTGSELGHLFYSELGGSAGMSIVTTHDADYGLFSNIQNALYWSGSEWAIHPNYTWFIYTTDGGQYIRLKEGSMMHAWAVRPGDVVAPAPTNPVSEPGCVALLGLGLLALRRAVRRG